MGKNENVIAHTIYPWICLHLLLFLPHYSILVLAGLILKKNIIV